MKFKLQCKLLRSCSLSNTQILILLLVFLYCPFQLMASSDSVDLNANNPLNHLTQSLPQEKADLALRDVLALMLQNNPELASFAKEVLAFEGTKLQASKFKNPDFAIEAEDINALTANVQRFTTFRISQLFELGGKRRARMNVASLGQELADKSYEVTRLALIARTANTFIDVLAGQERVRVAEETLQLTQKVLDSAYKRVESGKAPPIEETRSRVALSTANIELEQARRDLASARAQLALLWGSTMPKFGKALGDLESTVLIPPFEVLEQHILNNPLAQFSVKNIEHRNAIIELEKSRQIPDVTLGGAVRQYMHTDNTTALLNLSIPIPVFDRNQGNLQEAYQRLNKAKDEQAAAGLLLRTELTRAYQALQAAQNEVRLLHDEVLPGARNAFEVANRGYELGRFSFLEMLDAQRALFQNRVLYVRALANYQRLVNEIERLIAGPIDEPSVMTSTRHSGDNEEYKE
ncbi:TolC family protein [Nitrosomonas sp. Nm33]|uniref:TolC family protein n=1 Tax=Nitrosomonas sp. Nm33 TaxID=133724 RepID=UPI000899E28F|nr:TolC family protein [Nitrosomonas sp. Nm33]SDY15747.1 outer membrane protein, cobalt-zinc-cadmium efflux system [Nitrosomonas sp. Nm33]